MMKEIKLTQGKVAQVDDEDYDELNQYKWDAIKTRSGIWYARRRTSRTTRIMMHQQMTSYIESDHKDGDGLNNQRINVRDCTHQQNCQNRRKSKSCSSIFKGVSYCQSRNLWAAHLKHNGKGHYLGRFKSEVEAAIRYNLKAIELFGEFARLNEVHDA
jgi:hypothetical protein